MSRKIKITDGKGNVLSIDPEAKGGCPAGNAECEIGNRELLRIFVAAKPHGIEWNGPQMRFCPWCGREFPPSPSAN